MSNCIFIDPVDCTVCLGSHKLQCLLDHQHMMLTEQGKVDLRQELEKQMASDEWYKTKHGEEQRGQYTNRSKGKR